ncbi:MAG: hypothetical protein M3Y04_00295 [Actinomycetota bacterium]|nr:hypothetical protein [Actinomycetota bacterium]
MADRRVARAEGGRPLTFTVLLVNDVASVGGGQTVMLQVAGVLLGAGFETHVASPPGFMAEQSLAMGATWHRFSFSQRRLLTPGRRIPRPRAAAARAVEGRALAALAHEVRADIVHTGALVPHLDTQVTGRRLRARRLWHLDQCRRRFSSPAPCPPES